ncbi:MAG: glycosyltransferase family 4 protein [Ignavibacteriaceae bacterium]|nr:glycosyltransferase family 4 protein [Ignavibacteriaceae bacterium]
MILFVGRLCHEKGFDKLIKAFELLRSKNKNIILIAAGQLIGNKNDFGLFLNSEGVVYITPRSSINYFYEISNLVILPSRVDPFPFVMLESGSFKKPFIGGNTGGIAEFIEDGKNGLLVDPENPEELADKIFFLLNNPEFGKTLGENLYEKVTRLCDYNNYFKEVENIYKSLLTV